MTPKEIRNEKLAAKIIKNLKRRNFEACYCATSAEAIKAVSAMIPDGSSVTWGGSMTIRDMGLTKALHERDLKIFDRDEAKTRDEAQQIYHEAFSCDYYLSSVNAISEDGVIVNIDGNGNRVAAIVYGPESVIVIAGMNKVMDSLDAAVERARTVAAPQNKQRFDSKTPCEVTGVCADCKSDGCICNQILITRNCNPPGRIKFILVGEELGL